MYIITDYYYFLALFGILETVIKFYYKSNIYHMFLKIIYHIT